jgi:hypothetical protein
MLANNRRSAQRVTVLVPFVALVLACTAVPAELRCPRRADLLKVASLNLDTLDIIANVAGFVPLGFALANAGAWPAIGTSASISLIAESSQLFSTGRSPSVVDLLTNTLGAALGLLMGVRWRRPFLSFEIGRRGAAIAAALTLLCVGISSLGTPRDVVAIVGTLPMAPLWSDVSARGRTAAARLEAHWTFDETDPHTAYDESGNGLDGSLTNGPTRVAGVLGQALKLNGSDQHADFGSPLNSRLTGSMTISGWINASRFPADDAAIVSTYDGLSRLMGLGYQLDTTVDEGLRTISFKLTGRSGRLMARYGRTPLEPDRWYHVAGVYDASSRTLDVYLNGKVDNGCLLGPVTSRQRVSGRNLFVGRRGDGHFEFAGTVDDVRIYSRALSASELQAEAHGGTSSRAQPSSEALTASEPSSPVACATADPPDSRVAIVVLAAGMFIAVACIGWWPTSTRWQGAAILAISLGMGFLQLFLIGSAVPLFLRWLIPWLSLAGGSTIVISARE